MISVLVWWLSITWIGLAAMPLAFWLFARLPGHGLGFSHPLGLLLASYILWIGATLRLLPNNLIGVCAALLLVTALSAWLALRPGGSGRQILAHLRTQAAWLLAGEILFALAFLGWVLLRTYSADKIMPTGGEKFMEMAFLNSILRSPSFPPPDPWLSGQSISYYYFGYVMMALLTTLTQTPAAAAFDLYDALLFALTFQAAYSLVGEMAALSLFNRAGRFLAGLCAALFTAGIGNLEGLLEALNARGWLPQGIAAWLAVPGFPLGPARHSGFTPSGSWWWWRASRVLQDVDLTGKPIAASPITEFPFFSFLLGDNHPHVLALPFVLLSIGIALEWSLAGERLNRLRLGLAALVIGSLVFLNTWDYPTYFVLALAAFLAGAYSRAATLQREHWQEVSMRLLGLAGGAVFFYLPFVMTFKSQAGGLLPNIFPPTRLAQYLLMFGPFILILAGFLIFSLFYYSKKSVQPFTPRLAARWWLHLVASLSLLTLLTVCAVGMFFYLDAATGGQTVQALQPVLGSGTIPQILSRVVSARLNCPALFLLLSLLLALAAACIRAAPRANPGANPSDPARLFAVLLALLGLALTFNVEFFYLRDGFGVRMNSVFKFYFQGWVLMACASSYALVWLLHEAPRQARFIIAAAAAVLIAAGLVYPLLAIPSRASGFSTVPVLDAASNLRLENPDDWAGIDWLKAQVPAGQPAVLLEAPCGSYCYGGRISAFTGIPAVLGWSSHEAQWRGGYTAQTGREQDIAAIYTTAGDSQTLELLRKWQVRYVILGETEHAYIRKQCASFAQNCSPKESAAKIDRILTPAFQQGGLKIFAVPVE